jgi:hypothetical protein
MHWERYKIEEVQTLNNSSNGDPIEDEEVRD